MIGPTLGGFITDSLSWNWVFYVNMPVGLPVVALFIRFFPNIRPVGRIHRLDFAGMALLALIVVPLLIGLSLGGIQYDWLSPQIIGILAFAAVMILVFVAVERRASDPIMPLSIYSNRTVSVSLVAVFLTGFGMFGSIIFIPLFFQGALGASATSSGSFLTPMMLGMVVAAGLSGQVALAPGRALPHPRAHRHRRHGGRHTAAFPQMTADTSVWAGGCRHRHHGHRAGDYVPKFHHRGAKRRFRRTLLGAATLSDTVLSLRGRGAGTGRARLVHGQPLRHRPRRRAAAAGSAGATRGPARRRCRTTPRALVNPEAMDQLQAGFAGRGPQGAAMVEQLLAALRETLASAIGDVFLLVTVATGRVSFVVTLFLKEVPLRTRRPGARVD